MSISGRRLLAYAVMAVSLLVAANLIKDIIRLNRADKRLVVAETQLRQVREEQAGLKRRLESAGGGFWLEKQIRDVLGMAKPNEVIVVVPEEILKVAPSSQASEQEGQVAEDSNLVKWLKVFGFNR